MRLLSIILLLVTELAAQPYSIDTIDELDGLSSNVVRTVFKDSRGFMWFGTYNGLNKFDGRKITTYRQDPSRPGTISNNDIHALFEDSNQYIWVGTSNGLNRYDPRTDRFTVYNMNQEVPGTLSNQMIHGVAEDEDGFVWVATGGGGLNKFDPETNSFTVYRNEKDHPASLHQDYTLSLLPLGRGRLLIGLAGYGVDLMDVESGTFTHIQYDLEDPQTNFRKNVVRSMLLDGDTLWVSSYGGVWQVQLESGPDGTPKVLDHREAESLQHIPQPLMAKIGTGSQWDMIRDREGNFWVGSYSDGLLKYHPKTGDSMQWVEYTHQGATRSLNSIFDLYFDPDQEILWVATNGRGVKKVPLASSGFQWIPMQGSSVTAILQNKGSRYVADYGRGLRIEDVNAGTSQLLGGPQANSRRTIADLELDAQGKLWVATAGQGIQVLSNPAANNPGTTAFKNIPGDSLGLKHNVVRDLLPLSDSVMLALSAGGVNGFHTVEMHPLPWGKILSYGAARNALKVGLNTSGGELLLGGGITFNALSGPDASGDILYTREHYYDFRDSTSISDNTVNDLLQDGSGRVWVATDRGLNQYDLDNGTFIRYTGMYDEPIRSILCDTLGRLWMGTDEGILRFDPERGDHHMFRIPHQGSFLQFVDKAKLYADGRMHFGAEGGYLSFDPGQVEPDTRPSPVAFTGLTVFNEPYRVRDTSKVQDPDLTYLDTHIHYQDTLVLDYADRFFTLSFAALDYRVPENIRYQYRLRGLDDSWIDAGRSGRASFTSLDPGSYTLQLRATNSDGVWNQVPKSMAILIAPPWWLTPWFKTVAVAVGLLLLSLPFLYRIGLLNRQRRQQEEVIQVISSTQEKERQRISRDLHDSVGGQLAGIKQKLSQLLDRVPELQPTVDLLDDTYDEVRRISHNITPGTLMKLGLPAGIQSLAETVHSDKTRIQTYFFGLDGLNNKDYETNVFRIVQELLQNALKHGKASEIEIQLTRRDQVLSVMVSDNGQGFDTSELTRKAGLGLKNIAHRVRQLKGHFNIDSTPGNGTSVTVEIPVISGL